MQALEDSSALKGDQPSAVADRTGSQQSNLELAEHVAVSQQQTADRVARLTEEVLNVAAAMKVTMGRPQVSSDLSKH